MEVYYYFKFADSNISSCIGYYSTLTMVLRHLFDISVVKVHVVG